MTLIYALYAILSYLLGAVPTGYILYRILEKKDIRHYGSQATGATNVLRLKGWKLAPHFCGGNYPGGRFRAGGLVDQGLPSGEKESVGWSQGLSLFPFFTIGGLGISGMF